MRMAVFFLAWSFFINPIVASGIWCAPIFTYFLFPLFFFGGRDAVRRVLQGLSRKKDMAAGARRGSDARKDGERMTALHNVARSLVSMVRSSGIRKDYSIDDDHGELRLRKFLFGYAQCCGSWKGVAEIGRGRFGVVLKATRIADGEVRPHFSFACFCSGFDALRDGLDRQ